MFETSLLFASCLLVIRDRQSRFINLLLHNLCVCVCVCVAHSVGRDRACPNEVLLLWHRYYKWIFLFLMGCLIVEECCYVSTSLMSLCVPIYSKASPKQQKLGYCCLLIMTGSIHSHEFPVPSFRKCLPKLNL